MRSDTRPLLSGACSVVELHCARIWEPQLRLLIGSTKTVSRCLSRTQAALDARLPTSVALKPHVDTRSGGDRLSQWQWYEAAFGRKRARLGHGNASPVPQRNSPRQPRRSQICLPLGWHPKLSFTLHVAELRCRRSSTEHADMNAGRGLPAELYYYIYQIPI